MLTLHPVANTWEEVGSGSFLAALAGGASAV
jgi:hypothetical protein